MQTVNLCQKAEILILSKQKSRTMRISKLVVIAALFIGMTACNSNKSVSQNDRQKPPQNQERRQPPSVEEIFAKLDKNKDGQLAKAEVEGPLKNDFQKIDTNSDGFISKEELNNAPKPNRGRRPQGAQ